MDRNNSIINIPFNLKLIIAKSKKNEDNKIFYIINNNKKFILFYKKEIYIDKWGNKIILIKNKKNPEQNKINKKIWQFLNSWDIYFFCKIKFKGKGFRIKFFKKIKLIKFYFGKSHKTFLLLKKIKRKKINKYKFTFFGLNKNRVRENSIIINKIKKINLYTLRGLRLSRQIIFKRKGKKGTYI